MAKKSKQIKFTDEEIKSLQDLQTIIQCSFSIRRFRNTKNADWTKIRTNQQRKASTWNRIFTLNMSEQQLVNDLNEKYGPGNLDPNTGVFTPTK